jgi:hypothetical protein
MQPGKLAEVRSWLKKAAGDLRGADIDHMSARHHDTQYFCLGHAGQEGTINPSSYFFFCLFVSIHRNDQG